MSTPTVTAPSRVENRETVDFFTGAGDGSAGCAMHALLALLQTADQDLHSGGWDHLKEDSARICGTVSAARLILENLVHRMTIV